MREQEALLGYYLDCYHENLEALSTQKRDHTILPTNETYCHLLARWLVIRGAPTIYRLRVNKDQLRRFCNSISKIVCIQFQKLNDECSFQNRKPSEKGK